MATWKRNVAQGITLVELLVVLTILGLMAAVAIPTFARLGFFSRNETQRGAQELYKLLSATRVLAATNRVNTALAYGFTYKSDSFSGQSVKTIESFAIVQKVPADCKLIVNDVEITDQSMRDLAFVPAAEMQGVSIFRPLPQNTALLAEESYAGDENELYGSLKTAIHIYPGEYDYDPSKRSWSFRSNGELTQADGSDTNFPAHVFTPAGRMEWSNPVKERCEIHVAYPPDADPVERLVNPETADPQRIKLSDFRAIDLELYRGTGRVRIKREEN